MGQRPMQLNHRHIIKRRQIIKTGFENSFVYCVDKLDIMKKLLLLLLLVPITSWRALGRK